VRPKPITSIEELLKHDVSYPASTPVIVCDSSPWRKFTNRFKVRATPNLSAIEVLEISMKRFLTIAAVLALLAVGASAKDKNIVVKTDRFTGKTEVMMKEMGVGTFTDKTHWGQNVDLTVGAIFSPGPKPLLLMFCSYSKNWQFLGGADVYLLVDGERIDLGHFSAMKGTVDAFISVVVSEAITSNVDRSTIEKISAAKNVEIKIGTYETKLNNKGIERFRAFVAALPVEAGKP
jgi:hypothetical protein